MIKTMEPGCEYVCTDNSNADNLKVTCLGADQVTGYEMTDADNGSWTFDRDGNLTQYRTNDGTVYHIERTEKEKIFTNEESGEQIILTYDEEGRMVSARDQADRIYRFVYDEAGRMTGATDPLGEATTYLYSGKGKLEGIRVEGLGQTGFLYEKGRLTARTDMMGNTTRYETDIYGNKKVKRIRWAKRQHGSTVRRGICCP